MRYLAAYMLCQLGGKEHPTANDLKHVLESVGIESDADRMKQLMAAMEGKEVNQLITEGSTKLSSVPMGGAPVAAASTAGGAAAAPAASAETKTESKPEKKEAPKEESESEEDLGFGLFD